MSKRTCPGGERKNRVSGQLARAVVRDVTTSIYRNEFSANLFRRAAQMFGQIGVWSVGEGVLVLDEQ